MKEYVITVPDLTGLQSAAYTILDEMKEDRIFAINGKMGAGKTTLIKALCEVMGVKSVVSSPTFSIVNEYTAGDSSSIYHFDFYRIKKIEEVYDIGYEEYFFSGDFCFIEWPELVMDLLPERYVELSIEEIDNNKRIIKYKVQTLST